MKQLTFIFALWILSVTMVEQKATPLKATPPTSVNQMPNILLSIARFTKQLYVGDKEFEFEKNQTADKK